MSKVQYWSYPVGNSMIRIRTIIEDGQVLFCGFDVATALGYANAEDALAKHCKGVAKCYPLQIPGGVRQVRFITEGDLYRLIASSQLPDAQRFESRVFDEVLPSIRNDGASHEWGPWIVCAWRTSTSRVETSRGRRDHG